MLYVWYPKNRTDLNTIHEENDVIETGNYLELRRLNMRMEHSRAYEIR